MLFLSLLLRSRRKTIHVSMGQSVRQLMVVSREHWRRGEVGGEQGCVLTKSTDQVSCDNLQIKYHVRFSNMLFAEELQRFEVHYVGLSHNAETNTQPGEERLFSKDAAATEKKAKKKGPNIGTDAFYS
ncbi:hypothetical protein ElyMa_002386400 [Elysia marginata]|uniref:Uncharacterized protein n=1 Tax=Elysia marginata TaxID=1093978 RepID=A0AAV4GFX9_9GAST|nr:hypothetical protein ElyMa_002386400 [Elysia marginata]